MPVPSVSDVLSIPTRWGGVTNGANSITAYLAQQQQKKQELQYNLANQLINAQALRMGYGGGQSPEIASMLNSNPYGKGLFPNSPQGAPDQSGIQPNNNSSMPSTINANGMFGLGGSLGAGMQSPSPMAGSMNANPLGNQFGGTQPGGNVMTSASMEYKPFVGMVPSKVDIANPKGEATVAGAKSYAEKSAGAQQGAQESESRDIQQLAMIKNAIKPLVDNYNQVYNGKDAAFIPAGGDIYGSKITENADKIPRNLFGLNLQNMIVPPNIQRAAGQFLANKNELVTKLQPLLSQQFGKEGSSRIMETLVKMSQQEIGDLSTPKAQFQGQISGTLSSLYRIAKASQAYSQDLANSGQQIPDPNTAATEITRRMASQTLSSDENKELQAMIEETLRENPNATVTASNDIMTDPNNKFSGEGNIVSGAQLNPINNARNPQQNNSPFTKEQILAEIQRRKLAQQGNT